MMEDVASLPSAAFPTVSKSPLLSDSVVKEPCETPMLCDLMRPG